MPDKDLKITTIQTSVLWEEKAANLQYFEELIASHKEEMEVVVLPEMFSTGFSMAPENLAEDMDGQTVAWMKKTAAKYRIILTGSIIIKDNGSYYNRMLWVQPDGLVHHYDKRHLFGFAGEDQHYAPGEKKVIVQVKGWKILLQVCYDLRFPVFARNEAANPYDAIIYAANWPARRALAWNSLLPARAIENQCYVVGVNRTGDDGNGIAHSGNTAIYSPMGEAIYKAADFKEAVVTNTLSGADLDELRLQLPFLKDGDGFRMV